MLRAGAVATRLVRACVKEPLQASMKKQNESFYTIVKRVSRAPAPAPRRPQPFH